MIECDLDLQMKILFQMNIIDLKMKVKYIGLDSADIFKTD